MRTEMQNITCFLARYTARAPSKAYTFIHHPIPCVVRATCRRLGLAGSVRSLLCLAVALLFGFGEARAQVITRVSAPGKFYVDDKASLGLLFNYAAYMISNNTAATIPSVYVA